METIRTAVVVKATGSRYMLHDLASQATVEGRLRGRLRLSGSRSTSPVVVGDIVDYEPELPAGTETAGDGTGRAAPGTAGNEAGSRAAGGGAGAAGVPGKSCTSGTVVALHPRRNYIIRRASNLSKESHIIAANIDQALLVVSLVRPATNSEFIDRFLVTAGAYHIPAAILLNKSDLYTTGELQQERARFIETYTRAGYDVVELSASRGEVLRINPGRPGDGRSGDPTGRRNGSGAVSAGDGPEDALWRGEWQETRAEDVSGIGGDADSGNGAEASVMSGMGMEPLLERLRDRVTLLSGNSGVGKSTLIRAIDPSLEVRVGEVSDAHHKGRHTTTFSEMYPLAEGGWLIDTPGIKGFGLIDLDGAEIARYFPELFRLAPGCSYYNCTHTHEPGCAVKEALSRGEVSLSRYESYLKLLDDDEKYRR